jgi:hypothetical protein
VEKTSRLRSRDQVASGVKCGPHGGKNGKMKSWTVSWLSLKIKVEPVNGGASTTLGLHLLHAQEGGWGRTDIGMGKAGRRPRPILARLGRPFATVGPLNILHFAPSNCVNLMT